MLASLQGTQLLPVVLQNQLAVVCVVFQKSTECVIGQAIADRRRHIVMQKKLKKHHDLKEKCEAKATAYEAAELRLHIRANTAQYIEARNA